MLIAPKTEARYFAQYQEDYPQEVFDVVDYEEAARFFSYAYEKEKALLVLREEGMDEPRAKMLLPYLSRMTKNKYKSQELIDLLPLKERLVSEDIFQMHGDSAAFFCGKPIIIRGYYSGIPISEALQDLPNISLNWDLGRPSLNKIELPRQRCANLEEAVALAEDCVTNLLSQGVLKEDIYFRSDIPGVELPGIQILEGPYIPNDAKVIYLETDKKKEIHSDIFSSFALAELHLATSSVCSSRIDADQHCFLSHPSLVTRLYISPLD